jgi:hypothetical protein
MDFGDLGKKLIGLGAPILGGALGGPLGAAAGKILAETLGASDPTPAAIDRTIASTPAAEVQAKLAQAEDRWVEAVKSQAELARSQVEQVNETMRAEVAAQAARPDNWWGAWRTQLAQVLVLECPVWVALIVYCVVWGRVNDLVLASGLIMTWWGARFGVLGVHVWTGSHERRTAMTGETVGGVVSTAIKAIRGK